MIQVHARGRDKEGLSSRPATLGMLSDPLPQEEEEIKSIQHTVVDVVIYNLGKMGRKNRVEDERGWQDEGIRLEVQI